jgi:flagellar protein FliO/FliZ
MMARKFPDIRRSANCITLSALLLIAQGVALASEAAAFAVPAAAAQNAGTPGVGRVVISLILVLALLLGGAWLTRRVSGMTGGGTPRLRMLANISLGARERAVLIAVDGREVLLGVAPGNVRTLLIGDPVAMADADASATGSIAAAANVGAESKKGASVTGVKGTDLKTAFGDILRRSLGR